MSLIVKNLNDLLAKGLDDIYSVDIQKFKSKNNDDVENFLKNNAVHFCKLKQAVTYLVFDEKDRIIAYFTLAFKILEFPIDCLSKSMLKVLERNSNRTENTVQVPGMLLAQWSKNFAFENDFSGKLIMELVEREFLFVQNKIGGVFAFLECEADKTGLLRKYEEYGYKPVSERLSKENKPLVQFIKKI